MLIVTNSFVVDVKMDRMYVSGLILNEERNTHQHLNFNLCAGEVRELVEDDMVLV